jgi:hypothetical protein
MPVMKNKSDFSDRKIEPLQVRRARRAIEAPQAMKDYLRTQEAVRERMTALRQERLAREEKR